MVIMNSPAIEHSRTCLYEPTCIFVGHICRDRITKAAYLLSYLVFEAEIWLYEILLKKRSKIFTFDTSNTVPK